MVEPELKCNSKGCVKAAHRPASPRKTIRVSRSSQEILEVTFQSEHSRVGDFTRTLAKVSLPFHIRHQSIDMAGPLSPISTNVAYKHKSTVKVKEPAANRGVTATQKVVAKKAERDKNHAAPPPQHLLQPPGPDGIPEQKYTTGRLLGKGGFAICYEGQLVGPGYDETAPKFALKIVKAEMKAKNIVEKVSALGPG